MDSLKTHFAEHPMLPYAELVLSTLQLPKDNLVFHPQTAMSRRFNTVIISTRTDGKHSAELVYNGRTMYVGGLNAACNAIIVYNRYKQRVRSITLRTDDHVLRAEFAKDGLLTLWYMGPRGSYIYIGDHIRISDGGHTIRIDQRDPQGILHGVSAVRHNCQRPAEWLKTNSLADLWKHNGVARDYSEYVNGKEMLSCSRGVTQKTVETDAAGRICREIFPNDHKTIQYIYDGDSTTPAMVQTMTAPNSRNGHHHELDVTANGISRRFIDGELRYVGDTDSPYAPVDEDGLRHGEVTYYAQTWTWVHGKLTRRVTYRDSMRDKIVTESNYFPDGSYRETNRSVDTITHYRADGVKHGNEIVNASGRSSNLPITCHIWSDGKMCQTRHMDINHNILDVGTEYHYTFGRLVFARVGDLHHYYNDDGDLKSTTKELTKSPYSYMRTTYPAGTKTPSLAGATVVTTGPGDLRSDVFYDANEQPIRRVDSTMTSSHYQFTITDDRLGLNHVTFRVCHRASRWTQWCTVTYNDATYELYPPGLKYFGQEGNDASAGWVNVRTRRAVRRHALTPKLLDLVAQMQTLNTMGQQNIASDVYVNMIVCMVETFGRTAARRKPANL